MAYVREKKILTESGREGGRERVRNVCMRE